MVEEKKKEAKTPRCPVCNDELIKVAGDKWHCLECGVDVEVKT